MKIGIRRRDGFEMKMRRVGVRIVLVLAGVAMVLTVNGTGRQSLVKAADVTAAERAAGSRMSPANPVHHCTKDTDETGNTDVTDWSYVYFGSYPQSEVTGNALTAAITGASYDENGDAWVNGTKYRRISKGDTNNTDYFGNSTYRYFKWERIKWRVLNVNSSMMFVVADSGLDCKCYNDTNTSVT